MKNVLISTGISPEVRHIIEKLQNRELNITDIPEKYAFDMNVVKASRAFGLRESKCRGFDVLTQKFFVEEQIIKDERYLKTHKITFESFADYYKFLEGDIYENACYYQYLFSDEFVKNVNINISKLKKMKSFVTETVDDYQYGLSRNEIIEYDQCEKANKEIIKRWIAKFNTCTTYNQFQKVCDSYKKTEVSKHKYIDFFLFQYAFADQSSVKRFNILMEYLSKEDIFNRNVVLGLCLIYTPDIVLDNYTFLSAERKKEVEKFIEKLKNQDVEIKVDSYFDKLTHFYCEETKVYHHDSSQNGTILNLWNFISVCRAFETFDEFIKYKNGNLKNCNLSGSIKLNVDFSKYTIDDKTRLPLGKYAKLEYKLRKWYSNGVFYVDLFWMDESGKCVSKKSKSFSYFFDFVAFLKGDLSGADLLFCTQMKNLSNINGINLNDAKMTSELCKQFNISYITYDLDKKIIGEFPQIEKNEKETALALQSSRELVLTDFDISSQNYNRISYITDLHLMHKLLKAKCKSREDEIYIFQKIIDSILAESTHFTLIGGDVSADFSAFSLFVKMLRKSADRQFHKSGLFSEKREFIFILGNHELWKFPGLSVEQIAEKYRSLLQENGMHLLQNDLFSDDIGIIPYDELIRSDNSDILKKLKHTRLTILGGLGFAGYNHEFNANAKIYRSTVDRTTEIQESKKFEQLYDKLTDVLTKKNTIIFTHTPKKDWCSDASYHEKFVYVNGHTHRNVFFDDGAERIYADNQIGYYTASVHLKNFLIDRDYDCFADYEDGIHEITAQEYQDFAHGKNMNMTFNRKIHVLYMLKKNGYYCFIHKTKSGSLSILNGGKLKSLDKKDIQYYYDNMDTAIAAFKNPLDQYTTYQKSIANEIKQIGGTGTIHGCIIDIDLQNHVYINPLDMTITYYWASDIIKKLIYPDLIGLLKDKCSTLYLNYMKLIEKKESNLLILKQQKKNSLSVLPQEYLETDIYRASREISKMQKLSSNVLTIWLDTPSKYELPCKE